MNEQMKLRIVRANLDALFHYGDIMYRDLAKQPEHAVMAAKNVLVVASEIPPTMVGWNIIEDAKEIIAKHQ